MNAAKTGVMLRFIHVYTIYAGESQSPWTSWQSLEIEEKRSYELEN